MTENRGCGPVSQLTGELLTVIVSYFCLLIIIFVTVPSLSFVFEKHNRSLTPSLTSCNPSFGFFSVLLVVLGRVA